MGEIELFVSKMTDVKTSIIWLPIVHIFQAITFEEF